MKRNPSKREQFYNRYEYLAAVYASKIFSLENISYELADVEQEFKLLIWEAIGEFAKKWRKYKLSGKYKPVPLPFYLKNCLINKTKDLTKKISHPINHGRVSVESNSVDVGVYDDFSIIDFKKKEVVVRGVNFLEGLSDEKESAAFCMYLKGHKTSNIKKIFPEIDVRKVIEGQIQFIKGNERELELGISKKYISYSTVEE